MLVGVYGTLKSDYSNHRLLENYTFVGTELVKGFDLYDLGPFSGIKPGDNQVFIEIYDVNDQQGLDALDRLEGYPYLYDKTTVITRWGETLLYVYNRELRDSDKLIKNGFWYDTY